MKKYKPIVILYLDHSNLDESSHKSITEEFKKGVENAGYKHSVIFGGIDMTPRVEIISVDKATIVEDIQKYIDLKIEENDKQIVQTS